MFKYLKTNKQLREELEEVKEMLAEERDIAVDVATDAIASEARATSQVVLEKVLKEGVVWYDIKGKSEEEQRVYYTEAQAFLKSAFVNNEVKKLIADLISKIAVDSESFKEVKDIRMTINGLQLLIDRAGDIEDPDAIPGPTTDNIHSTL